MTSLRNWPAQRLREYNIDVVDCQLHHNNKGDYIIDNDCGYRYNRFVTSFGNTLKRIREAKGLSQREVARRTDMDHARFSRLENDRTGFNPTRETVEKIAQSLEATEEERRELLAAAGRLDQEIESMAHIVSKHPAVAKLLRIIIRLSQNQIEELLRQVERNFPAASEETANDGGMQQIKKGSIAHRKTRSPSKS